MTIDRKRAEVTRRREGEERLSLTGQSPLSRAPVASQRRAKRASVCLDCHSLHREFLATRPAPQGFRVAYSRKVLIKPQGEGIKKRCRSRPNNNCTRRRSGQSRPSGSVVARPIMPVVVLSRHGCWSIGAMFVKIMALSKLKGR
jgi:hypothetical protein